MTEQEPSSATDDHVFKTTKEVSEYYEMSHETVRVNWVRGGMPGRPGAYRASEITAWLKKTRKRRNDLPAKIRGDASDDGGITSEIDKARAEKVIAESRLAATKAELAAFEARKKMEVGLVNMEDVDAFFSMIFAELRRLLLRLPKQIIGGYPAEIRQQLDEELTERAKMILRAVKARAANMEDTLDDG